jgi:hypothetical protein
MQQRYLLRSDLESLRGPQGIPGGPYNWHGDYDAGHTYVANDAVRSEGRSFFALQETTGNAPPNYPDTDSVYWAMYSEKGEDGIDGGIRNWHDMPGSPTRISDTSFSITDAGNANSYDKIYCPGSIISWEKSGGGWQAAKIITATYSSDAVTFTILGNTLSAGFSSMKYCTQMAKEDCWTIPGSLPAAALTNIGRTIIWQDERYIFSAKVYYGTAPTTTGGVWDINDDGATIFTSKPSIAAAATEGTEVVSNSLSGTDTIAVAAKSLITLDYDSGHATTPGSDAVVFIWTMPVGWRYRP